MQITDLKARLEEIAQKEKEMLARHKEEISEIRELERDAVELYLMQHAKFKVEERVIRKGDRMAQPWVHCFIARRVIDRETWGIEYYTYQVKKDGSPGRIMSGWPYPEDQFKPYSSKSSKFPPGKQ